MKEKMKIYLGGPIAGASIEELHGWRDQVKKELSSYTFLDPTDRVYSKEEEMSSKIVNEIITLDKVDISISEIIFVNLSLIGKLKCIGSIMELIYAFEKGKFVVVIMPTDSAVSPWITYHSHFVVNSIAEGCKVIKNRFDRFV